MRISGCNPNRIGKSVLDRPFPRKVREFFRFTSHIHAALKPHSAVGSKTQALRPAGCHRDYIRRSDGLNDAGTGSGIIAGAQLSCPVVSRTPPQTEPSAFTAKVWKPPAATATTLEIPLT